MRRGGHTRLAGIIGLGLSLLAGPALVLARPAPRTAAPRSASVASSHKPPPTRATVTPRRRTLPGRRPAKPVTRRRRARIPNRDRPTGFAGGRRPPRSYPPHAAVPVPDRWRVGVPPYDRYPQTDHEAMSQQGHWWDPYRLNVLKGDYPLPTRQNEFLALGLKSETLVEGRVLPVPRDLSTARPDSGAFFGKGDLLTIDQTFYLSAELFRGNAGFRPRKWELRSLTAFNFNYLDAQEHGVVNINPARGTDRFDGHIAFQELFVDHELAELSPYFDVLNLRAGIQHFVSDFRGFVFSDDAPGVNLHGTWDANRWLYTLAYFRPLEKDTNSGLNLLFADREQDVVVANVTRNDFLTEGYNTQLSLLYNGDYPSTRYDENGFPVRPAIIGSPRTHTIKTGYVGWTGDGHVDRLNVSHAFYWAIGHDDHNAIAGRPVDINAQMAALEVSYDRDWLRFKSSFFWASGDRDPTDGTASGFDAIRDVPAFAGGGGSFWQRQGIKLTGTNVLLVDRFSLLPTLRPSKNEGQANFVNPGIWIANLGVSGRLTPKLAFDVNVNYLRFDRVAPLRLVLLQRHLPHDIGIDYGVTLTYRPLLIDNIILTVGAAGFAPLEGFRKIFSAAPLFQAFAAATLAF